MTSEAWHSRSADEALWRTVADCFLLLAVGAIPLLILEMIKVARHARRRKTAVC